ncbi:phage portal protein, HK97 family [Orenia metallireducens]|uniref:Phage portal protein, HK97 family n=1 Tax=Orenia metallireducens TaxID=1413210 RepID=A0A285G718_9FIRM|nr:phage portal protein [Orenia metallireducens]SNY19382.1 phage portal protein, HK97 family [Orenia metallireducens]
MGLWTTFLGWFNKDGTLDLDAQVSALVGEVIYKELAIQACINLIANAVSRSEFQTFERGKETKKDNYYLFNVEPNPNKSASKFWRDVISELVYNNECLVIQQNDYFYVAEDYNVKKYAFVDYLYKDIIIKDSDSYKLKETRRESDVFCFELHNEKIRPVIDSLNKSYSKLIEVSQKNFKKNNSRKIAIKVPTSYPTTDKAQADLKKLFEEKFKTFFEAEGEAVIPFTNGIEHEELSSNIGVKGGADNKQIRSFIDDIFDFVAIAFNVPPTLLKGQAADTGKCIDNLLTFCVNPLCKLIEDEINRKYYKKKAYLDNTYLKIDTTNIKSVDITDVANSLDILTRIGAFTIDDSLKKLGKEPLRTELGKARWLTKNYERAEKRMEVDD